MTDNFFKYLTPSNDDRTWGLYLTVVGKGTVSPGSIYPKPEHPSGYIFSWEKGRVLNEFQINYIISGAGIFECEGGKFNVNQGNMIILRPGLWHRYKPLSDTGWTEQYVGFNGKIAKHLLDYPLFASESPVIDVGIRDDLLTSYFRIYDLISQEKPGFQKMASGMIVQLLGNIVACESQKDFVGNRIETIIERARFDIRKNVEGYFDWEQLAADYGVGYSYFRKMFRQYTGMSPHQYHLELKILRARELLATTDKTVKEICFKVGFHSVHYFSRLFKEKTGSNPSDYRLS
jgi:AraC-like DNA-binding protein